MTSRPTASSSGFERQTSVPQERLGNNGAVSSAAGHNLNASTTPLERQNASFGSFDFLKLLETGPNGLSSSLEASALGKSPHDADDGLIGTPVARDGSSHEFNHAFRRKDTTVD